MKILHGLLMALTLATTLVACSKDDSPPPFTIEGKWEGKIGSGSVPPSGQYALQIKAGGTIERIGSNGSVSASGTWALNGNNFVATYFYSNGTEVHVEGTIDKEKYKLTANWENNGGDEGTLYANKK